MDGTIGEIRGFGGVFNPANWAFCNGQLLSISNYQALYSIIGTTYGGDGVNSFALPNLRGRAPMGAGQGPGLTPRVVGQYLGQETVTLNINNLPAHTHAAVTSALNVSGMATGTVIPKCCTEEGDQGSAVANCMASRANGYASTADSTGSMAPIPASLPVTASVSGSVAIGNTGGTQYIPNFQPSLGINWIICLMGIYPTRD